MSNATTQIQCPQCQQRLNVRPEYEGKRVACKHCQAVFTIKLPAPSTTSEDVAELESLKVELAAAQSEIAKLRTDLLGSQEKHEGLAAQHEVSIENERSFQSKVESLMAALHRAQDGLYSLGEESTHARKASETRIHQLESERNQKEALAAEALGNLEALRETIEANESRFQELETALKTAETGSADAALTIESLKALQSAGEETVADLRSSLEDHHRDSAEAARSLESLKDQVGAGQKRITELETSLDAAETEGKRLESHINELNSQIENLVMARDEDAQRAAVLAREAHEIKENLQDQRREFLEKQEAWERESERIRSVQSTLEGTQDITEELRSKDAEIAKLREELAEFSPLIDKLNRDLESAQSLEKLAKSHLYQLGIRLPQ